MKDIRTIYTAQFNEAPTIVTQSPGRINLIGEHIDYNTGYVLPAAINKYVQVAVTKRGDSNIHLFSVDLNETKQVSLHHIEPHTNQWVNYVIGVVAQIQKKLGPQKLNVGFNICLQGDIPIGAGLSSSAAVECSVVYALNALYQLNLDKITMTLMAQKAEHEFAGVMCGIMDQFASMYGQKDHVLLLDCDTLKYEYYPLILKEHVIVLLDTQVKHALASSEYNVRRQECEQGLSIIKAAYPLVKTFRDVEPYMIPSVLVPGAIRDRCTYVVQEIARVQKAVKDLLANDLTAFGQKMFATHQGLSKLYEVSCPELDFLVKGVENNSNVIGARMMGGGFGGCTINIVKANAVEALVESLTQQYQTAMGKTLKHYIVSIEQGSSLL